MAIALERNKIFSHICICIVYNRFTLMFMIFHNDVNFLYKHVSFGLRNTEECSMKY